MSISCLRSYDKRPAWVVLIAMGLWFAAGPSNGDVFDKAAGTALDIQDERRATQATVEKADDQAQELLGRYRIASKQVADLQAENARLDEQVAAQFAEIASLETQIAGIEVTQREIYPQMEAMLTWLDDLKQRDLPFLLDERDERLNILVDLLGDPDARLAEKLGRLLEAYSIELDYGRNLEAWRGALPRDPDGRVVELLRVGRIGLFYMSLDGESVGRWDGREQNWRSLDKKFVPAVRHGLRLARKQVAPSLLTLPLPSPTAMASRLDSEQLDSQDKVSAR